MTQLTSSATASAPKAITATRMPNSASLNRESGPRPEGPTGSPTVGWPYKVILKRLFIYRFEWHGANQLPFQRRASRKNIQL
jgi:hypothetical protein